MISSDVLTTISRPFSPKRATIYNITSFGQILPTRTVTYWKILLVSPIHLAPQQEICFNFERDVIDLHLGWTWLDWLNLILLSVVLLVTDNWRQPNSDRNLWLKLKVWRWIPCSENKFCVAWNTGQVLYPCCFVSKQYAKMSDLNVSTYFPDSFRFISLVLCWNAFALTAITGSNAEAISKTVILW